MLLVNTNYKYLIYEIPKFIYVERPKESLFPTCWKFIKEQGQLNSNKDNQILNHLRMHRISSICENSKKNSLSIENIQTSDATERLEESIMKFYGNSSLSVSTQRPKTNVSLYLTSLKINFIGTEYFDSKSDCDIKYEERQ